jgi:hypothetical protein
LQGQKTESQRGEEGTSKERENSDPENIVERCGESLLHSPTHRNVLIRVNRGCDSNEIDENDLHSGKHSEQRISTFCGIMID